MDKFARSTEGEQSAQEMVSRPSLSLSPPLSLPYSSPSLVYYIHCSAATSLILLQVLNETKKQHRGLRCSRCFALLCRDDDFEYTNGQLHVTGEALKASWDGLIMKGGMVCISHFSLSLSSSPSSLPPLPLSNNQVGLLSKNASSGIQETRHIHKSKQKCCGPQSRKNNVYRELC
jgi:hypothetical protein